MSETTLSAEVEAALEELASALENPTYDLGDLYASKAHLATLRTALERAGRIEAAARDYFRINNMEHSTVPDCRCSRCTLRAALNEEGA
jgi:hypothetical protein